MLWLWDEALQQKARPRLSVVSPKKASPFSTKIAAYLK